MGMYTEFVISTQIKNKKEVVEILRYMTGQIDKCPDLPNHVLFKTPRWICLFRMSSYYFVPRNLNLFEYDDISDSWCLISRSDLKNYDNEIELFIDWIKPYLEDKNQMFAYSRYEETREPTIYYGDE